MIAETTSLQLAEKKIEEAEIKLGTVIENGLGQISASTVKKIQTYNTLICNFRLVPVLWIRIRNFFLDPKLVVSDPNPGKKEEKNPDK